MKNNKQTGAGGEVCADQIPNGAPLARTRSTTPAPMMAAHCSLVDVWPALFPWLVSSPRSLPFFTANTTPYPTCGFKSYLFHDSAAGFPEPSKSDLTVKFIVREILR